MISRELLSEVLAQDHIVILQMIEGSHILKYSTYTDGAGDNRTIDTRILSHKCKEWAFDKGYRLRTQKIKKNDYQCVIDEINIKFHSAKYEDTEPGAVFKACEWIMER